MSNERQSPFMPRLLIIGIGGWVAIEVAEQVSPVNGVLLALLIGYGAASFGD
jgi:hypothetical protein